MAYQHTRQLLHPGVTFLAFRTVAAVGAQVSGYLQPLVKFGCIGTALGVTLRLYATRPLIAGRPSRTRRWPSKRETPSRKRASRAEWWDEPSLACAKLGLVLGPAPPPEETPGRESPLRSAQ